MRLSLASLAKSQVPIPAYAPAVLEVGIVHFGPGAFHRAHQLAYLDDALEAEFGPWGVCGVSLRTSSLRQAIGPQDGLYALELANETLDTRVIGCLRSLVVGPSEPHAVFNVVADKATKIVTLTVTEKGYCLDATGRLDLSHPDVVADLADAVPVSAIGWLVASLDVRRRRHGAPLTVISCDNLAENGRRLREAVLTLAGRLRPDCVAWIAREVSFPDSVVDRIVPASGEALQRRVSDRIGLIDALPVGGEPYTAWAIEDAFVTPRPAWHRVGVEFPTSVTDHRLLKLRVLNAAHTAIALFGLERGCDTVAEAVADGAVHTRVDALVQREIIPLLPPGLQTHAGSYWSETMTRFQNKRTGHRLRQIAMDTSAKYRERLLPSLEEARSRGALCDVQQAVLESWMKHVRREGRELQDPRSAPLIDWASGDGSPQGFLAAAGLPPVLAPVRVS